MGDPMFRTRLSLRSGDGLLRAVLAQAASGTARALGGFDETRRDRGGRGGSAIRVKRISRRELRPLAWRTLSKLDHNLFDRRLISSKRRGHGIASLFHERDGLFTGEDHPDGPLAVRHGQRRLDRFVVRLGSKRADSGGADRRHEPEQYDSSELADPLTLVRLRRERRPRPRWV